MSSINTFRDDLEAGIASKITTAGREALWKVKELRLKLEITERELEKNPEQAMKQAGMKETLRMCRDLANEAENQAWWSGGLMKTLSMF